MSRYPSSRGAQSATWRSRKLDCFATLAMTTMLCSCSLAPDFKVPDMSPPAAYKEQVPDAEMKGEWAAAQPLEKADRGEWWKIFGDAKLNELEEQAIAANPSLKAAAARVEEARANVRANAAAFLPQIDLGGNALRTKPPNAYLATFGQSGGQLKPYTLYGAGATASYEVDLFGRVRGTERAFQFTAEAEEGAYRSVTLALQADVAQNYYGLRALDAERKLLRDTLAIREEARRIMQKRVDAGAAEAQDLARTESELAATQADLTALDRHRATLEHALAILLGAMPSTFSFAEAPLETTVLPPHIPPGLPSTLLERRPDVASAQASMAAANAQIGVARAAFFPSLILTASGGMESTSLSDLFTWTNRTWALGQLAGNALSWTLFDNGRTGARVDVAKAAYEEAVANYRAQALIAFRDVEDSLSEERLLAEQANEQNTAADAASEAERLTRLRYENGDADYFELVDANRTALTTQRGAVQTRGQRFTATVMLIRALGGGWTEGLQQEQQRPHPTPLPQAGEGS